jgi:hypothetical protein
MIETCWTICQGTQLADQFDLLADPAKLTIANPVNNLTCLADPAYQFDQL